MNIVLTQLGLTCALGKTTSEIIKNAKSGTPTGFCYITDDIPNQNIPFFSATDINEPNSSSSLRYCSLLDCVVEQLIDEIERLKSKYPLSKLGIILGSSNTGVHEATKDIELWINTNKQPLNTYFDKIRLGTPASYLKEKVGFMGPAYTISTACSSSAKAFLSAQNLINSGICDAMLVGGVDERCNFAHQGFFSLSALTTNITNPFSKYRDGINLGEGAALFIMEKGESEIEIKGIGESTDGVDLTHPDPTGDGAKCAMWQALHNAKLSPNDIDYINMHGTGTIANDAMEGIAIYNLFYKNSASPICASTKSLTGHTLGASGAIELALSYLMLKNNFTIMHKYDGNFDDSIPPIKLATGKENVKIKNILSNSFAFGGSNVSIVLGKN